MAQRSPFGAYLEALLATREMSARSFALKVGAGATYVSKVMRGEVPISAKFVEPWADVLGLQGKEREEWREKAWSTRTPDYILAVLAETRRQLAAARKRG